MSSSTERQFLFVQSITIGDDADEVLMEHVKRATYIETGDISGVKLLLTIMDGVGQYNDDYGLQKDAELTVTFSDIMTESDTWQDTFIVEKAISKGQFLEVECFETNSHDIKQLEASPQFFTDKQPKEILASLLPNLTVESDTFNTGATYHLNSGSTKAKLIRQMARDYGAMCFIARGTVYFKEYSSLTDEEATELSTEPLSDRPIANHTILGEQQMYERVLDRKYIYWDTVEGMQTSSTHTDKAVTLISAPLSAALDNQSAHIIPNIEMLAMGDALYTPSLHLSVVIKKQYSANELNETIQESQIVKQVSHHQEGNKYVCKIEAGVVNG